MQINRLFEIIYILLNKKTVTAKELAEHFSVSTRTIYRDVDSLSLAGIPIYTEKGKGGGISLLPNFVLNKSILNEQERKEILVALQGLSSVKTVETTQVLQKLSTIFNQNMINWLEVDFSNWSFEDDTLFPKLKKAILERRIVEFDYYSTYGEKTHRRIEPLQLLFKSRAWYLKGFCLIRQDVRLFKLLRLKNLHVLDEHFSERTLVGVVPNISSSEHQKENVTLKLKIGQTMAYRVYDEFDESMVKKQLDGSFIVTVTWPEDDWVYGTILSYGEHLEVLEPEYMREIIRQTALKIQKTYS